MINNYTDDDKARYQRLCEETEYSVASLEEGEDNGTPHIQGYVYFKNQRHFTSLKKKLPRAHLQVARGSGQENRNYILHEGPHKLKACKFEPFLETGDMPQQGKRTEFDTIREAVAAGQRIKDIIPVCSSYQGLRTAELLFKFNEQERDWVPEVRWYYGGPGVGKSRSAREWLGEDIYCTLDNLRWWDGYDAHEGVLIDDFRKTWCSFEFLLRLLDRYPLRVETKGGTRQFLAKKIAITTTMSPQEIYEDTDENLGQLTRRISEIIFLDQTHNT